VALRLRIEHNDELRLGHQSPHGLQIALGIGAFAKGSHRDPLHFGQQAHDKPPIQRVSVRHNDSVPLIVDVSAAVEAEPVQKGWSPGCTGFCIAVEVFNISTVEQWLHIVN